jgi:hypothetical protein
MQVALGCSEDFARAILSLADDRARCRELGVNARRMMDERFTKARALERWHKTLLDVAGAR